jgi:hypothetical protein
MLAGASPFDTVSYVWGPDIRDQSLQLADGDVF